MKNDSEKLKIKNILKSRVYLFALKVIGLINELPNDRSTRIISDQLLRSATSIGANYIEAQAAASKKDFKF